MRFGVRPPPRAERREIGAEQADCGIREFARTARREALARSRGFNLLTDASAIGGEHRRSARQRLQRCETKSLVRAGRGKDVPAGEKVREAVAIGLIRQEPNPGRSRGALVEHPT